MEKYLPVGTVCTLNRLNRKYLIVGYFSLEFNSNIKMYDYVGIPYPEGMLLHNKIISFNHNDISKVDFLGYIDEKYQNFNKKILSQSNETESFEESNGLLYNFKFDENGVVIYEYKTDYSNEKIDEEKNVSNLENPFNKKYNFSNNLNEENDSWSIFEKYEFDEDGNVVSSEKIVEEKQDDKYKFDKNGILISKAE